MAYEPSPRDVAYAQGRKAAEAKEGEAGIPYAVGHKQRADWFRGYYDVQIDARFSRVFKEHDMPTMTDEAAEDYYWT